MRKEFDPDEFDAYEDYIERLKRENVMVLGRMNLLDLGDHYMSRAAEVEDWDLAHRAFRLLRLANNMANAQGKIAEAGVVAIVNVLANEDERKAIDHQLKKVQQASRDRMEDMLDDREDETDE